MDGFKKDPVKEVQVEYKPEKREYKAIPKKKVQSRGFELKKDTLEVFVDNKKQVLNNPPFRTFAGIFVPISIIEQLFNITPSKDGYIIERRT